MIPERIRLLCHKCLINTASDEDRNEFVEWMKLPENEIIAKDIIMSAIYDNEADASIDKSSSDAMVEAIIYSDQQREPVRPVTRIHILRSWWAAAAILLFLATGAYLWKASSRNNETSTASRQNVDISPGKAGAVLTLSDGKQVNLDNLDNGVIANESGTEVMLRNGQLVYDTEGKKAESVTYNTMTTPRGREFSLLLPDGTKVWLNAASSLRYPTVFTGKERKVEVSGEAYFEVAKNARLPFRVVVDGKAEVQVLGTHFNVNAYGDDGNISTTLLEGGVSMNGTVIKPGQQAKMPVGSLTQARIKIIDGVDMTQVMAWKNGVFHFGNTDLRGVMKQMERWYDINVRYEGPLPNFEFWGDMDRGVMLSTLLHFLSEYGVESRLEGKTLIVSEKPQS